ncbi:hypothetical protein RHMOL_Rhmol04G0000900 [Rhododendron molle]|uniref:Uncharacterized protein n=1 Tax=Rhododendron molle TaxID=49168 RepID=A0ACC0NWN9_RHOML|nr:hypothetical protein RHMOL_Rhmol04G0000900 [Rhododendron molle]
MSTRRLSINLFPELVAEKQEKRKFSRSAQQYQGGSKSEQLFYSYSRGGSLVVAEVHLPGLVLKTEQIKLNTRSKSASIRCFGDSKSIPKWRFKVLQVWETGSQVFGLP